MSKNSFSIGRILLQIALGVMLTVGGIWALQGGGDAGAVAVRSMFNGDLGKILKIVYGVVELLAGVILIIELFAGDRFGSFDTVLMIFLMIIWIAAIVLMDFLNGSLLKPNFLTWLYHFANHLIVLGAIVYLRY